MGVSKRRLFPILLLCLATSLIGCKGKDESKPNSELTVPDIPPAGKAIGKKGPTNDTAKNTATDR